MLYRWKMSRRWRDDRAGCRITAATDVLTLLLLFPTALSIIVKSVGDEWFSCWLVPSAGTNKNDYIKNQYNDEFYLEILMRKAKTFHHVDIRRFRRIFRTTLLIFVFSSINSLRITKRSDDDAGQRNEQQQSTSFSVVVDDHPLNTDVLQGRASWTCRTKQTPPLRRLSSSSEPIFTFVLSIFFPKNLRAVKIFPI